MSQNIVLDVCKHDISNNLDISECHDDLKNINIKILDETSDSDINTTAVSENNNISDCDPDSETLFHDLAIIMQKFKQDFSNIQNKLKNLEKVCKKEKKIYNKLVGKQNKGNKAPSGFAKPTNISDELCSFMNRDTGSKIARTEVTQFITKYIEQHDLQKKTNRQYIIPNEALQKLWDTKDGEEVTYFTIQRHMNRHFI
jgi:chromatin remodeling complex protein RSC6